MIIENVKKIENSLNRLFDSVAHNYGLTGKQFFVLGYIIKQSRKQNITQRDVENFGNVRKSSVSSILSNLEKNGFILRKNSEKDARVNIIIPTEKSYDIERALNLKKKMIEKNLYNDISAEEMKKCDEVLFKIKLNLLEYVNKN